MTYPMPCIYNISKNSDQIVIGDIVKSGRSYGVVKAKAEDGSIKIMNFNGNINNKIAIEDELMGSATFRVIVNPFNFDSSNGFNPLALAFMSGNRFDVKNLLMMSAFNGGGLFNNAGKGFNPIMLMALADKSSSDFMTITLMSQLMGGGNMFGNMFGVANKPATETPEPSNTNDGPQGEFKTGPFDYTLFERAIERHCLDNYRETYRCKFNIVITHWDCLKTAYIPTICDYQDKSPRIIGKIRFIEQFRTSNCTINEIYLGKSEDSNIKEL